VSEETTAPTEQPTADDRVDRLERIIRSMGRDSLELVRVMQEVSKTVAEMDLNLKGVSQTVWKAVQESAAGIRAAEEHYAGSLRDLERRMREEMQTQIYRACLLAVVPALDDLDLTITHARRAAGAEAAEGSVLEALEMVRTKLVEGLRALGLEEIVVEPGVTAFDPAIHQATDRDVPEDLIPDGDVPRGTIVFRRRAGFRLDGRLFRSPHVIVKT